MNQSRLSLALRKCRKSFIIIGVFSCFMNILMLTNAIYMLQIYDRVLSSNSMDTLIFLTLIAVFALLIYAALSAVRTRMLLAVSHWLDRNLSPFALEKSAEFSQVSSGYAKESMQDVRNIREFFCGMDICYFFDAPWSLIYLAVIYMLHPLLGVLVTISFILLLFVSYINELCTRGHVKQAGEEGMKTQLFLQSAYANAESIQAMGMFPRIIRQWFQDNNSVLTQQKNASDNSSICISLAQFLRMSLQIAILGTGAYLVIKTANAFTPGAMIAASILSGRVMAPIANAMTTWKRFLNTRQAFSRLKIFLTIQDKPKNTFLTPPKGEIEITNLYYQLEGAPKPFIANLNMHIQPGDVVALIGPSGAGKSTLARLMMGLWAPTSGFVKLDGAQVDLCDNAALGPHVGYCPQTISLLMGSVRDNIARMQDASDEQVIKAAKLAGVHEMIQSLPAGYNTPVTPYGLSGGQQQRIVLARAAFNNPCFIVLDEPNANLDQTGLVQLINMIKEIKKRGQTLVIVTHQVNLLQCVDKVAVLDQGKLTLMGDRDAVLQKLQAASSQSTN